MVCICGNPTGEVWHREYRLSLLVSGLNKSSLFSETVDNVLFAGSTGPLQTPPTKGAFSVVLGFRRQIPQGQRGIRRCFVWNRASLRFVILLFQLTFITRLPIVPMQADYYTRLAMFPMLSDYF